MLVYMAAVVTSCLMALLSATKYDSHLIDIMEDTLTLFQPTRLATFLSHVKAEVPRTFKATNSGGVGLGNIWIFSFIVIFSIAIIVSKIKPTIY